MMTLWTGLMQQHSASGDTKSAQTKKSHQSIPYDYVRSVESSKKVDTASGQKQPPKKVITVKFGGPKGNGGHNIRVTLGG